MTDVNTTIDIWFAGLNELDASKRAGLVQEAWAGDGRWVDPPFVGEGHSGINQMVEAVYQQYPDHRFRRVSEIDAHHDAVRYGWELVNRDGSVVLAGTDIAQLGDDGRLQRVTGFFGELAAA
jgi:hypothetical protein